MAEEPGLNVVADTLKPFAKLIEAVEAACAEEAETAALLSEEAATFCEVKAAAAEACAAVAAAIAPVESF